MKSSFYKDLEKEKQLAAYLDVCYADSLKYYSFQRMLDVRSQKQGVDLYFKHHVSGKTYAVDEKAQLDYVNEDLPTFAFELSYVKNGKEKTGWLLDDTKKTEFYALVTALFLDDQEYSSCKITIVSRKKLLEKLSDLGLDMNYLKNHRDAASHGRILLKQLNPKKEGYLFFSSKNKAERPLNLILKLEWLIDNKIAKRLF